MKEYELNLKMIIIANNKESAEGEAEFILQTEPIFDNPNIEIILKETGEYQ